MRFVQFILFLCISSFRANPLPVVYVYTVVEAVCKHGLPSYIKHSLEQAVISQPDCKVILASNIAECPQISDEVKHIQGINIIDTSKIVSKRTTSFLNVSKNMFMLDYGGELWITSALRFFQMEDIMINFSFQEIMHVEADNLLYGRLTSILPTLRKDYPGLAATPLHANKAFITASVFWIANLESLQQFNNYLLRLGTNEEDAWFQFLRWLRPFGCCKPGGLDPDKNGDGVKPFAVNEMSMLAYYHHLHPKEFQNFPVVPLYEYVLNKYVVNMSEFGPGGVEVGPPTGAGIWDPNSWGQFMGGTSNKRGRDKGFSDPAHVAGQAMRTTGCRPKMICVPRDSTYDEAYVGTDLLLPPLNHTSPSDPSSSSPDPNSHIKSKCILAPHVRCSESSAWTPLWNLHVHSKHTQHFLSSHCPCE